MRSRLCHSEQSEESILFLDKNGLLLTADHRSRNDPHGGWLHTVIRKNLLAAHFVRGSEYCTFRNLPLILRGDREGFKIRSKRYV